MATALYSRRPLLPSPADVTGGAGVSPASVGRAKSITDTLTTPANGDPRRPYANTTTFQYDANGNMIQESGPSGIINYVYDLATQRHTETWTGTNAVTDIVYGYNPMGELASVTVLKENGQTAAGQKHAGISVGGVYLIAQKLPALPGMTRPKFASPVLCHA